MSEFKECVYRINFNNDEERIANIRSLMAKLDAEGRKSDVGWNEGQINNPRYVFLRCYKNGFYELYNHDCGFKEKSFPLHQWPEQPEYNGWTHVDQDLPEPNKTIWMTDGKDWAALGCLVEYYSEDDGLQRCWAVSNNIMYVEEGEIVTECETDDLNVVLWMYAPKMPQL